MSVLTKLSVEDRLDIMELLVRYGRTLDTKDAAGYAALFAPDAVRVTNNGAKTQHGRAEIEADIQQSIDNWRTTIRHFLGPALIEGGGMGTPRRCARTSRKWSTCPRGPATSRRWRSTRTSASSWTASGTSRSGRSSRCSTGTRT